MTKPKFGVWQDISTAPKDGREMLLYAYGIGGDYFGVGQWARRDPDFEQTTDGWFWAFAIRPTHWMPLPNPHPPEVVTS